MSPRPYWKGYLKLALVSCPIALHAACASAERVSFRQINRKTGNRLRQQLIDEETREVVEAHDKARGYEIGKGQFLLIEDEELEAIEIASTHIIDIDSFVPRAEIDQPGFPRKRIALTGGSLTDSFDSVIWLQTLCDMVRC
jgi:DNA end-binding protein Ku